MTVSAFLIGTASWRKIRSECLANSANSVIRLVFWAFSTFQFSNEKGVFRPPVWSVCRASESVCAQSSEWSALTTMGNPWAD